ncbi:hypothetical protein Q1695_001809 [Nippostrongylus brasiliensis]|nr:hypothetical protein Q1695_001809 [Nippostrongylus brasiliensis]
MDQKKWRICSAILSLLLISASADEATSDETADKFAQLPEEKRKELLEVYNKSDVHIVHQKLTELRKQWLEKLKNQEVPQSQTLRKRPDMKLVRNLPTENPPTVLPIHEVNRNANLSEFMYQSDMVLTLTQLELIARKEEDTRARRQAYRDVYYPNTIWGNTLYYYFDPSATSTIRTIFTAAAKFWQENTCVKFVENSQALNRVRVFKGDGCYSYVGRVGGQQDLSLGKGCESVGTAAHELGHALGFFHSQSRVDRDSAITIVLANIQPDFIDQFDKETASTNYNYGMPYDYGSIMQYGATSASRNGGNTMIAKMPSYQQTMGSDIVAFYDISMMNDHYNCKVQCPREESAECQNGGYPNPNDCSVCNCPSGYGGTLCTERPPGCGATYDATPDYQQLTSTVGDGSMKTKIDFSKCNYWIQAPPGKQVEVRLDSYQGYSVDGCIYGGVEIKADPDQLRTGYRFCSPSYTGTTLTSTSNLLPIIVFNRYGSTSVAMSYRYRSSTTTQPRRCVNSFYNCNVLSFFGFCGDPNVRQRCPRSCNLC